jgi:hypothetical protein
MKHAILDAYENVAPVIADWSGIRRHHGEITVFNDHVADPAAVVERLRPFDAPCGLGEAQAAYRKVETGATGRIVLRPQE